LAVRFEPEFVTAVQSQRARGGILHGLGEEDQVDLAVQAVVVPAEPMADLVLVPQRIPHHVRRRRDSDFDPPPCAGTPPILPVSGREPGTRGRPSGTGGRRRSRNARPPAPPRPPALR